MVGGRPESEEETLSMTRSHWKKHRPKMFREMEKEETLDEMLQAAAQRTWEAMQRIEEQLIRENGYTPQQAKDTAWEMMREEWVLLPDEEDMPILGEKPRDEENEDFLNLLGMDDDELPRSVKI